MGRGVRGVLLYGNRGSFLGGRRVGGGCLWGGRGAKYSFGAEIPTKIAQYCAMWRHYVQHF